MPRVMTRCAETGRAILTHLVTAPKPAAQGSSPGEHAYAVYCPICRTGHIVDSGDLWLEADPAQVFDLD